jgi:dihydroxy-acid dehydratase
MYTANTMSASFEALGMSLLGSSTMANTIKEQILSAAQFGRVLVEAVGTGVRASAVVTRQSIENAVAPVMAIGGSTNLAIAVAAGVEWTIDDFERVRRKTPVIYDLKPYGPLHGDLSTSRRNTGSIA